MVFEFGVDGVLWVVICNEDGDEIGVGFYVCSVLVGVLGTWDCGIVSDPNCYDLLEMFCYGDIIYLVACWDIDGFFGLEGDLVFYLLWFK